MHFSRRNSSNRLTSYSKPRVRTCIYMQAAYAHACCRQKYVLETGNANSTMMASIQDHYLLNWKKGKKYGKSILLLWAYGLQFWRKTLFGSNLHRPRIRQTLKHMGLWIDLARCDTTYGPHQQWLVWFVTTRRMTKILLDPCDRDDMSNYQN